MGATSLVGSFATLAVAIAGLLYMVGARRLAGRALIIALALVLLGCLCRNLSLGIPAIDPAPFVAIGSLLLLGLAAASVAYFRVKRARRNRRQAEPARPLAPEPVPAVHEQEEAGR